MFTGIVQATGSIQSIRSIKSGKRLSVVLHYPLLNKEGLGRFPKIKQGSSIAINGVCLTVVHKQRRHVSFDVIPETLRRTNLGALKPGDMVNIEPSLRVGDELGGHFVLGHVDGIGTIVRTAPPPKKGEDRGGGVKETVMSVRVPPSLTLFIAPKGSIAVDGVSLTVVNVERDTFSVALIPYTLTHTNLGTKKVGDRVNIEVDVIAKYLQNVIASKAKQSPWDRHGRYAPSR